ncbi:uncharacterized protein LOC131675086 [Phymastichus coffea]|uniref:uncharacterized protein LOC131675086 n=1 Tax=Phymastichus coffea TaxID=108790 RepID=UPI00273C5FE6|nr:uncharacterized protein LOC131675086 [Phymastichus coffea]
MDSARHQTMLHLGSPSGGRLIRVEALVLRDIGIVTPSGAIKKPRPDPRGELPLADPQFDRPAGIVIVIGADAYSRIIQSGVQSYGPLLAQNTVFGWTLTGRVAAARQADQGVALSCATLSIPGPATGHERLLGLVQKFWSLEKVLQARRISAADVECEAAFARGCSRDPTGRYTVALPLRPERVALLGESLSQARSALASMHRRMQRDQELSGRYHEFMAEYENLGHMRRLTAEELTAHQGPAVYIPHHGIWQHHDRGRKLRVVFNASRPTSSGYSLNDALHAGPKLQGHVATGLTRWRLHRYAFCADIQMMFRQIRVRPEDVHLQRVLWSQDADSPAHHYALQTITYGEACAPYLALRTIR